MATFMDLSLLGNFSSIFVFLFIFVILYAFQISVKIFKEQPGEKGLAAIIAIAGAFLVMLSPNILNVFKNIVPWMTLLIIFLFLVFFVVKMFAGEDEGLFKDLIRQSTVYWILIVIFILIVIVSFSQTYGQGLLEDQEGVGEGGTIITEDGEFIETTINPSANTNTNNGNGGDLVYNSEGEVIGSQTVTDDFSTNVLYTFIHPKVLGMLMLLIIGFFTIIFLARSTKDPDNK